MSPLDTAPEVFLVVVVAVYATVPEQGESAAGRSSQEPGRSRTKCGTCPDGTTRARPRRGDRLDYSPQPRTPRDPARGRSRGGRTEALAPSEPGPLDTIVIGQQVPGGVHTPYRVATSRNRYAGRTHVESGVTNSITNARRPGRHLRCKNLRCKKFNARNVVSSYPLAL